MKDFIKMTKDKSKKIKREIDKTDMGRLAVVGRLVRPGESISVDTAKAVVNENIRYPQIWYDEHNMSNPYANSYQWIPE